MAGGILHLQTNDLIFLKLYLVLNTAFLSDKNVRYNSTSALLFFTFSFTIDFFGTQLEDMLGAAIQVFSRVLPIN